jgi:hypothetical protein
MICPKCNGKNLHQLKDGRFLCRDCENIFVAVKEPEQNELEVEPIKVIIVDNKEQITLSKLFIVFCLCFGIWWLFSTMYNAITADPFGGKRRVEEARQLNEEMKKVNQCRTSPNYSECMRK